MCVCVCVITCSWVWGMIAVGIPSELMAKAWMGGARGVVEGWEMVAREVPPREGAEARTGGREGGREGRREGGRREGGRSTG